MKGPFFWKQHTVNTIESFEESIKVAEITGESLDTYGGTPVEPKLE